MSHKLKLIACTALTGMLLQAPAALATAQNGVTGDTGTMGTTQTQRNTGTRAGTTANMPSSETESTILSAIEEGTNVTLSGTISRIEEDDELFVTTRFGELKVDTNDDINRWFSDDAKELFQVGKRITVTGEVDDDFLVGREINATYVTLQDNATTMSYAGDQNRQATARTGQTGQTGQVTGRDTDSPDYNMFNNTYDNENLRLSGTVDQVKEGSNKVVMDYNGGQLEVDLSDIRSQTQGYRINEGDFITVYGDLKNPENKQSRTFEAKRVIRMDYAPRG